MPLLTSSDSVTIALHDFGGDGAPLLISHATGFHAHAYEPLARALAGDFHCHGLDYRGHGGSTRPDPWSGEPVDWGGYGDDAVVAAGAIAPTGGIVGFGHSMGGTSLLMAAMRQPELFERLVLFEPIVYPPSPGLIDPDTMPIVLGARRRRARFESREAAYQHYRAKPPLSLFDDNALRAYIEHGFHPRVEQGDEQVDARADGPVELCCLPVFEAATFEGSFTNGVWDLLPEIDTPTVVIAGVVERDQPSRFGAEVAQRLPNGRYVELPHMTHFGPFTHIAEVADLVRARLSGASSAGM